MELGNNPGLGVRSLHERGITGVGVGIGIIDWTLLTQHREYASRLRYYDEICAGTRAHFHAPAVSSIAVGETSGVAPGAELYFIGIEFQTGFQREAQALGQLLDLNAMLPRDSRIRVVSISRGYSDSNRDGHEEFQAVVDRAKDEGVLVVTTSCHLDYGVRISGLDRHPLDDPDDPDSYRIGSWLVEIFFSGRLPSGPRIWAPMDSRCFASPEGPDDYSFMRVGGYSWLPPYMAGVYALCCQVKPDITPEEFWRLAFETSDSRVVEHGGIQRELTGIIKPVRLIERLENGQRT